MIGDHSLCAWVLGFRALIGNWSGRPLEALDLVDKGLALAPAGTPAGRLHAIAARAYAQLGNPSAASAAARSAVTEGGSGATADELHDRICGEFSFDAARLARCLGSAYLRLSIAEPAREHAQHVLDLYASSPGTTLLPKIEAEARIDLAHAHVIGRALDAAEAALVPVFEIDPGKRVHGITERLLDMRRALTAAPLARVRQAQELGARIEAFSIEAASTPALPPAS